VDNDDNIFLPFIEALVVDNWLRRVFDEVADLNPSSCEPLIRIDAEIQLEGGTGGGEESEGEIFQSIPGCSN
jgi:hypothetical protein